MKFVFKKATWCRCCTTGQLMCSQFDYCHFSYIDYFEARDYKICFSAKSMEKKLKVQKKFKLTSNIHHILSTSEIEAQTGSLFNIYK